MAQTNRPTTEPSELAKQLKNIAFYLERGHGTSHCGVVNCWECRERDKGIATALDLVIDLAAAIREEPTDE